MKLNRIESYLREHIEPELGAAAPGVMVQVYAKGQKKAELSLGSTYAYYDLASLTKMIFTVQAMMLSYDRGLWDLKSKVSDLMPWFPHKDVFIRDLLTHSSGLVWWLPFFEKIDAQTSELGRWTEGARIIRELGLENNPVSVYSDVGFITLGHLLEFMHDKPLIEIWNEIKELFYAKSTLNFHPHNHPPMKQSFYAPTERSEWRGKIIQGEVHDDNAWSFGGVSTHAGLFGSIDDVSAVGLFIRSQLLGLSKPVIKQKTAKLFATRARPEGRGDWALGYMMPSPGTASCGIHFSQDSIGHTGFTGTSLWYDPKADVFATVLSNRVFLGRDNKSFAALRPKIHNWIMEAIRRF